MSSSPRRVMSYVVLLLTLTMPAMVWAQQTTGAVSGTVRAPDGAPLRGVELVVEGTNQTTLTALDGTFGLMRVPAGQVKVTARSIGYAPISRTIDVAKDRMTRLEITLSESAVELSAITVLGIRGYGSSNTHGAMKMDVPALDVPQSVVVISEDFMQDQNATTLDDLLRNVAGISPFSDYQDFTARGFRSGEDEVTYNGTRSNAVNFFGTPNLSNVERVEVLKGPSGVLYGAIEGGAMINMVTKSPKATRMRSFSARAGSFNTYGATGDVTGPVTANGKLLYRLNGHFDDTKSFRRFVGSKNWNVAPALSWLPRERTVITLKGDFQGDNKEGARNRGTAAVLGDLYALPIDWTSNEPTDYANSRGYTGEVNVQHGFSANWNTDATVRYSYSDYENAYHESQGYSCSIGNATSAALLNTCMARGGRLLMRRQYRHQDFKWKSFGSSATLNGNLKPFGIENRILVGGDLTYKDRLTDPSDYANGVTTGPVTSLDLFNPVYGVDLTKYEGALPADAPFTRDYRDWGVHASDLITIIPQVKVVAGIRYSNAFFRNKNFATGVGDEHERSATTRRLGLVLQPLKWASVYGSFSEGFKPQINAQEDKGGPFDPIETHQKEAGVKFGFFKERLMLSSSTYRIVKTNILVPDPDPLKPNFLIALGEVTSKGWDIDLVGMIQKNWSITANYASNNTKTTADPRPTVLNTGFPNAPADQSALWTRYDVPGTSFGLAAGATHVGRRATFDTTVLPKYTTYDGAVYFDWSRYDFQINVKNITDERYFAGGYMAYQLFSGAPRSIVASVHAKF